MMNRREWLRSGVIALAIAFPQIALAQDDPGRANIGRVSVTVYYATNGDPKAAGPKSAEVGPETLKRLRGGPEQFRFKNYRMLGQDVQPLLRSYESWAQPLRPSDLVLVRFEARSRPTKQATGLNLDLWLDRKKVLKTDVRLEGGRPLNVVGPAWRGGWLIITVALAPKGNPGS